MKCWSSQIYELARLLSKLRVWSGFPNTIRSILFAVEMLYIDLRPGQTFHSKDDGSCIVHWRGRDCLTIWDRVKIPRYCHKLMHRKRVACELHGSYFRSTMIKTCHSKDSRSGIFRWPFMGRDWVGVELLYNSVHRKFNLGIRRVGEMML